MLYTSPVLTLHNRTLLKRHDAATLRRFAEKIAITSQPKTGAFLTTNWCASGKIETASITFAISDSAYKSYYTQGGREARTYRSRFRLDRLGKIQYLSTV